MDAGKLSQGNVLAQQEPTPNAYNRWTKIIALATLTIPLPFVQLLQRVGWL